MASHYGWYGDPAIRVAVQLPERAALGVVICPPLGQEGIIAYRGLRLLADELERRGIASVRYDPPGRGDAAPSDDPQAPVQGALLAAEVLRATGCPRVAFVGLSSAGLIASQVADDILVLWSPERSGKVWLRRLRSFSRMQFGSSWLSEGVESLLGLDLTPNQAAVLEALELRLPRDAPTLVAIRRGDPVPAGAAAEDVIEVDGTSEYLHAASTASVLPVSAITVIADWLAQFAGAGVPLTPPELASELRLEDAIERIRWIGPDRLFAIECSPTTVTERTPMVLLHTGAAERGVGPGDYQVELARALAADGARSIRADRRSAGETGPVLADQPTLYYSAEWIADQDAILAELGMPGSRVASTGLCVGGWLAGQKAIVDPRLVVVIHPLEYRLDPAPAGTYDEVAAVQDDDPQPLQVWYHRWAPGWLRRLRDRQKRRAMVEPYLRAVAVRSWRVVMVFSDLEEGVFERRGGIESAARLPNVELVDLGTSDHALFTRASRENVIAEVRRQVAAAFELSDHRDAS